MSGPLPLLAMAQTDPLKAAAAEAGATVTDSGLVFRSLKDGSGPSPAASDTVRVHYRGTLKDGTEFDSSLARPKPGVRARGRAGDQGLGPRHRGDEGRGQKREQGADVQGDRNPRRQDRKSVV